jgi:hypothetical protein
MATAEAGPTLVLSVASVSLVLKTLGFIALIYVFKFFYKLYEVRSRFRSLAKDHGIVRTTIE